MRLRDKIATLLHQLGTQTREFGVEGNSSIVTPTGYCSFLEFLNSASRSIGMHLLLERTVDLPVSIRRHKLNGRR